MDITTEKVVWIALILVAVGMVGIYLVNILTIQTKEVGQRMYTRLISSEFVDRCPEASSGSCYIVNIRVVNGGEDGMSLYLFIFPTEEWGVSNYAMSLFSLMIVGEPGATSSSVQTQGFDPGNVIGASPMGVIEIPPRQGTDITIKIDSEYIQGDKAVIITAFIDQPGYDGDYEPDVNTLQVSAAIPVP
ncbi:MAG: hypothetical protein QI199_06210 [Candidatus Korarchaeota archaeon]|nr:hypothetical protein [Candidatus Korarchaeota archaeon]